ncbi:MAG: hypothetical protein CL608_11745 [Anaerolineaceae bacterium]|nr:hypothetical protein [Anaerolineaceae bacterium]
MQDEARLVQQARDDMQVFATLYDRYVERIYAYALREAGDVATAEDIVSATFEKALKHLPQYKWRGISFGAWLYKIARNELRMHWRKQKWTVPLLDIFRSGASDLTVENWEELLSVEITLLGITAEGDEEVVDVVTLSSMEE